MGQEQGQGKVAGKTKLLLQSENKWQRSRKVTKYKKPIIWLRIWDMERLSELQKGNLKWCCVREHHTMRYTEPRTAINELH